jgi:hypothetical protein
MDSAVDSVKLAKERKDAYHTIMFMNPSSLDDKARAYWEFTRAKILARESDVEVVFEVAEVVVVSTTYTCYVVLLDQN